MERPINEVFIRLRDPFPTLEDAEVFKINLVESLRQVGILNPIMLSVIFLEDGKQVGIELKEGMQAINLGENSVHHGRGRGVVI